MEKLYVISPRHISDILENMVAASVKDFDHEIISDMENLPDFKNKKIIFAVDLNAAGFCPEMTLLLSKLHDRGSNALENSTGAILIYSPTELYTKTTAQNLALHANMLGCAFMGRPMVEAIGSFQNFLTAQKNIPKSLEEICYILSADLGNRLVEYDPKLVENPKILVIHASNYDTSNTLMLWRLIKKSLPDTAIQEIHIDNGAVRDCIGCSYKMCHHYGEQENCFYGGVMVEDVYPAVLNADAIVWICPNYNDNLSANISAVINRLTALFRKTRFYDKSMFGIIVSGSSGSDAIAKQLISALNMNKTFRLPPYFSIMATANDSGTILQREDIQDLAKAFAENMLQEIKA